MMVEWFEDDSFWSAWEPYLFSASRLSAASFETERIIELLGVHSGAKLLDVCCGIGRHTFELARRGFLLTGIDRTRPYIERAREQARREGLTIEFIHDDAKALRCAPVFDGALDMFTSFGYFDSEADDVKVASNVCRALRPGAKFLVDLEGRELIARDFRPREWFRHDDGSLGLQEKTVCDGWERLNTRWILIRDGKIVKESVVSSRIYSGSEMRRLLIAAGFSSVVLFGNLQGAPYDNYANRLIAVAAK
jgi:SAM-dependent methyltransferase